MDVIRINESSSDRIQTINIDDISSIDLNYNVIEIYLTGRKEPKGIYFVNPTEAARRYEALLSVIPHTTISTITL